MPRTLAVTLMLLVLTHASEQAISSLSQSAGATVVGGDAIAAPASVRQANCYAGPVARGQSRWTRRQQAAAAVTKSGTSSSSSHEWLISARAMVLPYYKEPSAEVAIALDELSSQSVGRPATGSVVPGSVVQEAAVVASIPQAANSTAAPPPGSMTAATTSRTETTSGVTVQSICPADPKFVQTTNSRTTCRLKVNTKDGYVAFCTAWFVTETHVVTAGHCSAENGKYIVNSNNPGMLCCAFNKKGNCYKSATWRLLAWVTTYGWWHHQLTQSDGSVYKVEPWFPNNTVGAAPQRIQSFFPGPIPEHVAYMDGFPGRTARDKGCGTVDETKRYYTQAQVVPLGDTGSGSAGSNGMPVSYPLAGCMGESGGRVLLGGPGGE